MMRILIADDNPVFRTVLKSMLTSWAYEVVEASDGEEAWSILEGPAAPRIAILDWMMPKIDGVEVCRRIRASRSAYVYILVLSAKTQNYDLLAAIDAGADDYVTKPFKSLELRVRLRAGQRILALEEQVRRYGLPVRGATDLPPARMPARPFSIQPSAPVRPSAGT